MLPCSTCCAVATALADAIIEVDDYDSGWTFDWIINYVITNGLMPTDFNSLHGPAALEAIARVGASASTKNTLAHLAAPIPWVLVYELVAGLLRKRVGPIDCEGLELRVNG